MGYPGDLKHLPKKRGYSQFTDGNETYPELHTAVVAELGMSLNVPGSPSPGPPHCAILSAQTLLTLRPPFIPDYLPFHLIPAIKGASNWHPSAMLQNVWLLGENFYHKFSLTSLRFESVKAPWRSHKTKNLHCFSPNPLGSFITHFGLGDI